jgi:archaellum component FlaC
MANQIGIPKYKDLINKSKLQELQNNVKALMLRYNMVSSDKAISNRESELYNDYMTQYIDDMNNIGMLRQYAQNIVDMCNEMNFIISKRSIENHVYHWDDEDEI